MRLYGCGRAVTVAASFPLGGVIACTWIAFRQKSDRCSYVSIGWFQWSRALPLWRRSPSRHGSFRSRRKRSRAPGRSRTHIIWNKAADTLVRKNFSVWDPHPELDLDFLWEPDPATNPLDSTGDVINGAGTLTWHVKGAANYDRRFTYSVFKGVLKNGRPEGEGVLGVRGGLSYTGHWVAGQMQGRGVLRFENGDKYEGDFVAGKMHGVGRYVSTDGSIYLGEFRDGLRHGLGKTDPRRGRFPYGLAGGTRNRSPAASAWRSGATTEELEPAAASNALRLKLTMDREAALEFETQRPDAKEQAFEADYAPGTMTIRLASKKRLAAWRSNAPIASGRTGPSYIEHSWNFPPVFLKAEIQNQAAAAVEVKGAFLDVVESALDPTPYVELHSGRKRLGRMPTAASTPCWISRTSAGARSGTHA